MKNKKILLLLVVFVIATVGVVIFFVSRPKQEELLPQTFAELPEKPKLIAEFHTGPSVYSVAFSPADPSLIASIDQNGTIKLWDINNTIDPVKKLSHPGSFPSIDFSPTGKFLASASTTFVLWDIATGMKLFSLRGTSGQFAFSPDGNFLAIPISHITLWDIRDPDNIESIGILPYEPPEGLHNWGARAVDFSHDGKWIAVAHNNGNVNVWDFKSMQIVKTLKTNWLAIDYLKFSPDNRFMCVGGSENGNIRTKSYIMWQVPNWKRHGEVQRGNIDNLVFHPHGKICVSANNRSYSGRGVELWYVENGAPITFLQTHARDTAFSKEGNYIATARNDGFIQLWELTSQHLSLATLPSNVVRIIYFPPTTKEPFPNITQKIDKTIKEVQEFYANEMERYGLGRKTFKFETDENGNAKIYHVNKGQSDYFVLPNAAWIAVIDDISDFLYATQLLNQAVGNKKTFRYPRVEHYTAKDNIWMDDIEGITPGKIIYTTTEELKRESVAYILKDAFGIPDPPIQYEPNVLKRLFSEKRRAKLSKCEAEWLDRSRFFNPNQPFFDKSPKMEMHVSTPKNSSLRHFIFEIADEDGMHQAQLFVPMNMERQRWRKKFQECQALNGKEKATITFEISNPEITNVELRMMDMHGNIASREFEIEVKTDEK